MSFETSYPKPPSPSSRSYSGEQTKVEEPNLVTVVKELIDEVRTIHFAIDGYHQAYFGGDAIKTATEKPSVLSPARELIEQVETAKRTLKVARGNLDDVLNVIGL